MRVGRWIFAALLLVALPAPAAEWTLRREDQGIRVWTRPVEGSAYQEFKGSVEAHAGSRRVLAVIQDAEHHPAWFFRCLEARELGNVSAGEGFVYSVLGLPWPFSARDSVVRWRIGEDDTGVVRITTENAPDRLPPQPRRVRVPHSSGVWEITARGPDRTEVAFQMHFEPGGSLPAWIANTAVVDMPYWTLYRLRERVESALEIDESNTIRPDVSAPAAPRPGASPDR